MNVVDYIVIGVIAMIMGGSIFKIVRDKKKGIKCTGCSGCSASGHCGYKSNIK